MMNKNLIKGIDEVINGLTTIKGALLNTNSVDIDVVKEAVADLIGTPIRTSVDPNQVGETLISDTDSKKAETTRTTKKVEEPKEEVADIESEEVEGFDMEAKREELEDMKYNDLKTLAGTLKGIDAKGKKAELIEKILKALSEGGELNEVEEQTTIEEPVEEAPEEEIEIVDDEWDEEVEYTEEDIESFTEFLTNLETDAVVEIAKEAGLTIGKRVVKAKLIKELIADLQVLINTLYDMGYYGEEEEEVEETEEEAVSVDEEVEADDEEEEEVDKASIVEEYGLNDYELEELAEICSSVGLSTKGKKQALIDRIVLGIMDGTIELEDDEEEEEEVKPAKSIKKVAEHSNPEVAEKEAEIEADIRSQYESKKLKDSAIKKFIEKYNEGNPEGCGKAGSTKQELLDCYISIHKSLVDDDADVNEFEEPYMRNEEYHCCGKEIKKLENGNLFCSVCGSEYAE